MSDSRKTSGTSPSDVVQTRGGIVTVAEYNRHQAAHAQRQAERKAERKARQAERKKPCVHRGKRVSAADAYGPKGVECVKLYECALHGLCSVRRVLPDTATCAQCGDYTASRRDPEPDSGVSG